MVPVLAIGRVRTRGEPVGSGIMPAAKDLQTVAIPAGDWGAVQPPSKMPAALAKFLAP